MALSVGMAALWGVDGVCQLLHVPWPVDEHNVLPPPSVVNVG